MKKQDFERKFQMLVDTTKYSPKNAEAIDTWYALCNADLADEEIDRGFKAALKTCREFPSFPEFRELAKNHRNSNDEIDSIVANVMYCLSKGGTPESSAWVHDKCGPIGYDAIGGHMGWYDIMSGNIKKPREMEIRNFVKATVKEQEQNQKLMTEEQKKMLRGVTNVARI